MFCNSCGTAYEKNLNFCTGCGEPNQKIQAPTKPSNVSNAAGKNPVFKVFLVLFMALILPLLLTDFIKLSVDVGRMVDDTFFGVMSRSELEEMRFYAERAFGNAIEETYSFRGLYSSMQTLFSTMDFVDRISDGLLGDVMREINQLRSTLNILNAVHFVLIANIIMIAVSLALLTARLKFAHIFTIISSSVSLLISLTTIGIFVFASSAITRVAGGNWVELGPTVWVIALSALSAISIILSIIAKRRKEV